MISLDYGANLIINILKSNSYEAYAVGGCVRDYLLGKECHDIDITTSSRPETTLDLLRKNNIKCIETGLKHGTITAIINDIPYEVTTYRIDGDYKDSRRPENVEFIDDISLDLSRRDFTINAMAFNESDGIVDIFNGCNDLKDKIIRCVGDPYCRFKEDALRILRALRFASVLSFDIDEATKTAIHECKHLLNNISFERICIEFSKLLCGNNCEKILREYRDVIAIFIPEMEPCFDFQQNSKYHIYDVYEHTIRSVSLVPKNVVTRFAMFLHDIGKPYCISNDENGDHFKGHVSVSYDISFVILKRLKFSNDMIEKITLLIKYHDYYLLDSNKKIKKALSVLGEQLIFDLADIQIADISTHNMDVLGITKDKTENDLKSQIQSVIDSNEIYSLQDLEIDGHDLLSLGYKGPEIGRILNNLLSYVIDDPTLNNKEKLIDLLNK